MDGSVPAQLLVQFLHRDEIAFTIQVSHQTKPWSIHEKPLFTTYQVFNVFLASITVSIGVSRKLYASAVPTVKKGQPTGW